MPINNKKLLVLLALYTNINCKTLAGGFTTGGSTMSGFVKGPQYTAPITETKSDKLVRENKPGSKPLFQVRRGDMEFTFGGTSKFESLFAKNIVFLNNDIPDELSYFRQTIDFSGNLTFGERKYGYKALEFSTDIRQKNLWGDSGKPVSTSSETIKIANIEAVVGSHSHKGKLPTLWMKNGWIQACLNPILEKEIDTQHYVKIGFFPFTLGRGIALGPIYGLSKDFLGIYTGYQSDQSAPGINVHGDIIKDKLSYDIYYAKLQERSASIKDTFNHIKYNHVGRSATPWRGVAKDNDLIALRVKWDALRKNQGELLLEPYAFYNEASDTKIEFEADAKNTLITAGLALEYKKNNFEFGTEGAFNFGNQQVYNIDRNVINLARNSTTGSVEAQYDKIRNGSATGVRVPVSDAVKTQVESIGSTIDNGLTIGTVGGTVLFNAADRFRPGYKNKFAGFMFVTDGSYTFPKSSTIIAATYGFASGDANPNGTGNEYDKTYHGFIGLQEGYAGKKVPSVLVLNARAMQRPLTLKPYETAAGTDQSFTDMHYFGAGLTLCPKYHDPKKISIQSNVLGYIKDQKTYKINESTGAATSDIASNFLGVEWNLRVKQEILKDLYIMGDFAIFMPGDHYDDTKGIRLRSDIFSILDAKDKAAVDSANYRLGNDPAIFANLALSYKF